MDETNKYSVIVITNPAGSLLQARMDRMRLKLGNLLNQGRLMVEREVESGLSKEVECNGVSKTWFNL